MATVIKRGAELLLKKAEEAYESRDFYRALEIAMSVYGATVSSESKDMVAKAIEAIDHPTNGTKVVSPIPVKTDPPAVKYAPPSVAVTVDKTSLSTLGYGKKLPEKPMLVKNGRVEIAKETPPVVSLDEIFNDVFDLGLVSADDEPKINAAVESRSAVVPATSSAVVEASTIRPEDMQLVVASEVNAQNGQVLQVFPPMNSKDPDELYADALREAEIDARTGLNREPILSEEEKLKVDENAARAIIESRDFFEMVGMKLWADVPQVEKAFKKAIFRVHTDRNKSPMAVQAAEVLIGEYRKFKAKPREYTVNVEKRRAGEGEFQPFDPNTGAHEGYGGKGATGLSEDGFDCYGKRSYTWQAANSGPKRHVDMNPEGNGAMYASPMGEGAWLEKIEYSDATAHKFKNGKYQTFSYTGESRSKAGTRFIAKNNQ